MISDCVKVLIKIAIFFNFGYYDIIKLARRLLRSARALRARALLSNNRSMGIAASPTAPRNDNNRAPRNDKRCKILKL